jgi:hypothetical protein
MSSSGPDEEHVRTVKRGAFPARPSVVEQAETFVPGSVEADDTAVDTTPPSTAARVQHPPDEVETT